MNVADRIQQQRKAKGVSQEELADKIGVSRQAVSKWESEQSLPDLDRIMALSDYFGVTTDYLLKGIEPVREGGQAGGRFDARIFAIVAAMLNFIGVATACALWHEQQTAVALAAGLTLEAIGCAVFGVGALIAEPATRERAKRLFWTASIWPLAFMPLALAHNVLISGWSAPYPIMGGSPTAYLLFWAAYLAVCLSVTLAQARRERQGQ